MKALIILISIGLPVHALADVDVPAAPAIAVAPERGLDPDVSARFVSADDLARRGDLVGALDAVLVVYQSPDPFSEAQRSAAAPHAAELLARIGSGARKAGNLVLAARALDARWEITGQSDPDLARTLVAWSERESGGRALYLARRARRVDPALTAAVDRDHELSTNRHVWTGRLAILAGAIALGAGIYADTQGQDTLATGLYIAAPVLSTGGVLYMLTGIPNGQPVSPAELPVLPEK
jgi:hypothetical protein